MPLPANYYVPQVGEQAKKSLRASVVLWGAVVFIMLVWMSMIFGAPVAVEKGYSFFAFVIYRAFSNLCHQLPERSFHILGHPFAVCARCTGIYSGLTFGFLIYPLFRSLRHAESLSRIWLLLAPVPTGIDFMLGYAGVWENTHLSRLLTGAVLGIGCAFFIVPGLVDIAQTNWRNIFKKESSVTTTDMQKEISERDVPSDYSRPSLRI
jgi:uncharacterized membrane protein